MNLYYVRHGKTQGNVDKVYVGQTESPLIDEGARGAIEAGKAIARAGLRIDAVYTSRLNRQRETARLIAGEISYPVEQIHVTDLLLERSAGEFEGKPQAEFFAASEAEQVAAGAESFAELANRAVAAVELARQEYPDGTVLFVGSAAIGEMMRVMIKYGDQTRMFDDGPLPNSELIQLV